MNIQTATTAYDQSLNRKPEKLSLVMVILWAFSLATYICVILASLSGERLPLRKSLQALKQLSILSEYLDSSDVCCTPCK